MLARNLQVPKSTSRFQVIFSHFCFFGALRCKNKVKSCIRRFLKTKEIQEKFKKLLRTSFYDWNPDIDL